MIKDDQKGLFDKKKKADGGKNSMIKNRDRALPHPRAQRFFLQFCPIEICFVFVVNDVNDLACKNIFGYECLYVWV